MWVTSLGLAGEAGIFASLPFYPMFSGVPNGPLRLSPPQVHAAVHNSGVHNLIKSGIPGTEMPGFQTQLSDEQILGVVTYLRRLGQARWSGPLRRRMAENKGQRDKAAGISYERILVSPAEPENWLTYSGDYRSHRHSALTEINTENVHHVRPLWVYQVRSRGLFESSPIVIDGIMYVTLPDNEVVALSTRTGRPRWRYEHPTAAHVPLCCGRINRGLAILGDLLFMGTIDAHVVALEARTGAVRWDVVVADHKKGYSITSAPLVVKDKVIVGIAGGEFGIRGFLDAYDVATGDRVWRFWTVPAPGEPGSESWDGESWGTGGGPTWLTGSFDPELNLIYWGVGNPSPVWNGDGRPGDNLYTNSVVALNADTGELKWYFQFTPHGVWDWDSNQIPVLVDTLFDGRRRKLVLFANRNGFYYVLDGETGEFLLGKAYARQTWARGLDRRGRPIVRPEAIPTEQGVVLWPSSATNWNSPSYSPQTGLFYVAVRENPGLFIKREVQYKPGARFWGGVMETAPGRHEYYGAVRAFQPETGGIRWEFRYPAPSMEGLLSTAGGLVFGGTEHGDFFALDAATGEHRWEFQTGGAVRAAPVTYLSEGKQQVAIAAGHSLFVFALPDTGYTWIYLQSSLSRVWLRS